MELGVTSCIIVVTRANGSGTQKLAKAMKKSAKKGLSWNGRATNDKLAQETPNTQTFKLSIQKYGCGKLL